MRWTRALREQYFETQAVFEDEFCSELTRKKIGVSEATRTAARVLFKRFTELMPNAVFNSPGYGDDQSVILSAGRIKGDDGKFDGRSRVVLVLEDGQFYVGFQVRNGVAPIKSLLTGQAQIRFNNCLEGLPFETTPKARTHTVTPIPWPINDNFAAGHPLASRSGLSRALRLIDRKIFSEKPNPKLASFLESQGLGPHTLLVPSLFKFGSPRKPKPTNTLVTDNYRSTMNKNTILYGPPGTGKTYSTVDLALNLLNEQPAGTREGKKAIFDRYINDGQIVFTTFHQSYAYEDFIEGIRVETNDQNMPVYKVRNGVFKQLARKATFYYLAQISGLEDEDQLQRLSKEYASTLDENFSSELAAICAQFKERYTNATPQEKKDAIASARRFVLVIDEINRGNISKVFGELITLIEDSKRLGTGESLPAVLPYSGEKFEVPANLYLIGTMNTADRSLATLDIALRRRFFFEELMPKPDELRGLVVSGINLEVWLTALNKKIQAKRGREFTIGHAFFMGLKSIESPALANLATIMEKQILPLLDEYFFDDWEGIRFVLGESSSQESSSPANFVHWEEVAIAGRFGSEKSSKIYSWNKGALHNPNAYDQRLAQG